MRIYEEELSGSGVSADQHQVENYTPLSSALASENRAAVKQAVATLVFSHTHVVRLRVTRGGSLLADVGGPYILAPVGGTLRFRGRSVGRYLLSVQDDLGFVKLESRFVGVPLVLHTGGRRVPLPGTLSPGPANAPQLGSITYGGAAYEAFSFTALAFPRGRLSVSLLVPVPAPTSARSCAAVRAFEVGRIAQRIWRRYALVSAPLPAYVRAVRNLTGALSLIRSGSHQLAASVMPGPDTLPASGVVLYRGVRYQVSSFTVPVGGAAARVYVLVA